MEKLAGAALAWAAGKALDILVSGNNNGIEITEAVSDAVTQLTGTFRGILKENDLHNALTAVDSLKLELSEYQNAPTSRWPQLGLATAKCNELVTTFKRFTLEN